jgi:hypothetical protein
LDVDRGKSDTILAKSFDGLRVVLQARIDDNSEDSNALDDRFTLSAIDCSKVKTIEGRRGWIPLPIFAQRSEKIGFVDLTDTDKLPVIEKYQNRCVKSLVLSALEIAYDSEATIIPGQMVTIKNWKILINERNEVQVPVTSIPKMDYLPFHRLISGESDKQLLEGKIVIIGYDGSKIHSVRTPIGPIKAHRLFCHQLFSVYGMLESSSARSTNSAGNPNPPPATITTNLPPPLPIPPGTNWSNVYKIAKSPRTKIKVPSAIVGIRG